MGEKGAEKKCENDKQLVATKRFRRVLMRGNSF
jgi:hypothetical protein